MYADNRVFHMVNVGCSCFKVSVVYLCFCMIIEILCHPRVFDAVGFCK